MAYTPPSSNNANLIFSGAYSAPSSSGADLIFGAGGVTLYQIWTDNDFVYAATNKRLDIYDLSSESRYAYVTYSGGFNTVWGNDDKIFVGTTNSGIKYLYKTCISGAELFTCLNDFSDLTYYHELTSDNIKYIHGNNDILCMVTESGVDVVKIDPQSYRSYTTISGARKCFMTTEKFYYTVSGTEWSLNRVDSYFYNWNTPDKSYVTGSGIFVAGISLNDIFVTENTGHDGISNTLFVATSSGVYVIDEITDNYDIYYVE